MDKWFERLTEQVALSHDEQAVKSTLKRLTREAGFKAYAYLSVQPETQTAISDYPQEWQQRYFEKAYAFIDPVVRIAKSRMAAFSWTNSDNGKLTKERRNFYGEAAEFGIGCGLSVPITTGFGRWAMLTLASDEPSFIDQQAFNPVLAAAAVGQLHARLDLMRARPTRRSNVKMKSDELTCLRWSAEGKSMKAIAIIENTTYANVAFFIRNAKAALGATTLPQATAMAKELGLI